MTTSDIPEFLVKNCEALGIAFSRNEAVIVEGQDAEGAVVYLLGAVNAQEEGGDAIAFTFVPYARLLTSVEEVEAIKIDPLEPVTKPHPRHRPSGPSGDPRMSRWRELAEEAARRGVTNE